MQNILLCADSESLAHPELMGLEDLKLDAIPWLQCFSQAVELRQQLKDGLHADEIWVVSSDDVEAINLLAALRKDDPSATLLLVIPHANGSALSRAQSAGANGTLTARGLAERFALENLRYSRMQEAEFADDDILLDDIPAVAAKTIVPAQEEAKTVAPVQPANVAVAPAQETPMAIAPAQPAKYEMQVARGSGQAFVLTVLSGSGGAGKSTVSAIAASLAAQRGHRTLLIDCDLQFGDMHRLMGVDDPLTLDDVLEDPEKLECLGAEDETAGPYLLAAPKRLEQSEVISGYLPKVLDSASALFDVIVVNTGASWADHHAVLLERSECSLFLVDQRTSSVRACQHALELCSRLGVASGAFVYAVNHCERGALFTSLDVAFVMQGAHVFELKEGGPAVEEMLGAGQIEDLLASKNSFCESVEEMLSELLPDAPVKERKRKKLAFGRGANGRSANNAAAVPLESAIDMPAGKRKRSSRRRGRSSKPEDIPIKEEAVGAFIGSPEEKKARLWR